MATANNMAELQQMLIKAMESATKSTAKKAKDIMDEEMSEFYTGTQPKMYERTYAMKDTPRVSDVTESKNSVSVTAYLDETHVYDTGKNPTMNDVLHLANEGKTDSSVGKLRKAVGKPEFWDRSTERIKDTYIAEMGKKFNKL